MKDYTGITVHTPVEKIIQNLDLEEEGELSHCQQSLMAEKKEMAVKRDDEIATVKLQQGDLAEKQEEKDSNKVTSSYPSMGENEPQSIPIARRILPEESFEPPHFSPWTVFGILLSLLASIFLWLGISGDTSTPGNGRDNNTNSFQNAQQEKQASVESRPAPTIGTSLHVPTPPSHPGKIPSLPPYPDLKTAILTEIRKNQALTGPHTPLPPSAQPPQIKSTLVYHVIMDYPGEKQYNRLKQQFPQILPVMLGNEMKIQFGAFYTEIEARQWSQFLNSQGLGNYILVSYRSNLQY